MIFTTLFNDEISRCHPIHFLGIIDLQIDFECKIICPSSEKMI